MSTIASTSPATRNSLLRLSVIAGLIIGFADEIIYHWLVTSVLGGVPLISVYQYIASGALGNAAFAGGFATALLGVLFHYLISIVIAGIFILSADRIPLLLRYFHCHEHDRNPAQCDTSITNSNNVPTHRDDLGSPPGLRIAFGNTGAEECEHQSIVITLRIGKTIV
jgi:uncharacterized membrane protein